MSVHDVREIMLEPVDQIQWSDNSDYNLVKPKSSYGIAMKSEFIFNSQGRKLVDTKKQALNLIKALEKVIELGWVK